MWRPHRHHFLAVSHQQREVLAGLRTTPYREVARSSCVQLLDRVLALSDGGSLVDALATTVEKIEISLLPGGVLLLFGHVLLEHGVQHDLEYVGKHFGQNAFHVFIIETQ